MKYISTIITILLLTGTLTAQEGIADKKQFNAAVLYHTQGKYDEAIEGFSRLIAGYPEFVKAYFFRGYAYLKKKDYKNALADFKIASELDKKNDKVFFYIGKIYYDQGQYQDAIGYFSKAISLNPRHTSALNDRGMAYYQLGQYDAAVKSFQSAIAVDPNFAMAYNNIGSAIFFNQNVANPTKKDLRNAKTAFTKAIMLDPTLFVAYYNRASMFYYLKNYDAALADIDNALAIQENNAMCHFYSGVIKGKQQNYAGGIASLEVAIELAPKLSYAYEEIGNIRKEEKQYLQAIQMYEKAYTLTQNSTYEGLMHYRKAIIYALQEDEASMYAELKQAHKKKLFRDKKVYQAFTREKAFKSYRTKKKFKKIQKKARKGKKTNKFENSELSWFRLEN
ncbi:MAG: tetratricopeptide repeat protein [Saprospiraceae bacterium]